MLETVSQFASDLMTLLGENPAERIATATAVLGGAASVIIFLRNQNAATKEARLSRYDSVSRSYIEFQTLCLNHPTLGTSWYGLTAPQQDPLSPEDQIRRDILFDILTSTLERAFITYRNAPASIKASQWPGWLAFARGYAERDDYRNWWRRNVFDFENEKWTEGVTQYDIEFERFIFGLLSNKARR